MTPEEIADLRRRYLASGVPIEMLDEFMESAIERHAADEAAQWLKSVYVSATQGQGGGNGIIIDAARKPARPPNTHKRRPGSNF